MSFDIKAEIKKPWVKWGLAIVAVIGVVVIYRSYSGSGSGSQSTASTGMTDSQAHDLASITMQQNQIAAQAASQESSQSYNLSALKESDTTQLSAMHIKADSDLALAGIQLTGLQSQLSAQTEQQKNQLNSVVQQAQIVADTQMHISDVQAGVATNASNNQKAIAKDTNRTNLVGGIVNTIGKVFGGLF
ncbi:MAG TPA: hypothetical protein VFM46_06590 [Pseudomonadales bacterium]|nr:hypothetical protein [Pseudomonadales bacterium]